MLIRHVTKDNPVATGEIVIDADRIAIALTSAGIAASNPAVRHLAFIAVGAMRKRVAHMKDDERVAVVVHRTDRD